MWPAVSGAAAQAKVVDTVANNLANSNTPAFKKDLQTFKEYLAAEERISQPTDVPRGRIKDKEFYPLESKDQAFVINDGTYTTFQQGSLQITDNPLDVALDGPGFLEVSTPFGVRYTRHGSLKLATDGKLVTAEGYPVLSSNPAGLANTVQPAGAVQPSQGGQTTQGRVAVEPGPEVLARMIQITDQSGPLGITQKGGVYIGERLVANLSLVEFANPQLLQKQGGQLYVNGDQQNVKAEQPATIVRQGMIENSNVNPVEEMTNLIKSHRLYEQNLKAIKTYDELMNKESNEIGKY